MDMIMFEAQRQGRLSFYMVSCDCLIEGVLAYRLTVCI